MDDLCQVGNTPEIEIEGIIFKREDLNPSGSVKDRGVSYQLNWAKKQGIKDLVISSSGNAAISACFFCQKLDINLFVFVSPKINRKKLDALYDYPFQVVISQRPKSDSIKFAKKNNYFSLRSSTDPRGTIGYQEIAKEILGNLACRQAGRVNREDEGGINSIFIPVSSGTVLVGVAEGFKAAGSLPQIHAVQTTAVNTIAKNFDQDFMPTKVSLADALVAKFTPQRKHIIALIKESKGAGWVVSDEQILEADKWLQEKGITTSFEGGATLAGIWKARKKGWELGRVICLLTGRKY